VNREIAAEVCLRVFGSWGGQHRECFCGKLADVLSNGGKLRMDACNSSQRPCDRDILTCKLLLSNFASKGPRRATRRLRQPFSQVNRSEAACDTPPLPLPMADIANPLPVENRRGNGGSRL